MKCNGCNNNFDENEIADGLCYTCSTGDSLDITLDDIKGMAKETIIDTLKALAKAKNIPYSKLTTDLIVEHFCKPPKKITSKNN